MYVDVGRSFHIDFVRHSSNLRNMARLGLVLLVGLVGLPCCGSTTSSPGQAGAAGSANGSGGTSTTTGGGAGGHKASGGSATGTAGAATLPLGDVTTPTGFCQGYYAIVADLFTQCWGLTAAEGQSLLADARLCQAFAASVDEKRVGFDPAHAGACLSELDAAVSCDGTNDMASFANCDLITPLVPVGGTCTSFSDIAVGRECMDDAFCQQTADYACTGKCTARSPIDTPCDPLTTDVRCGTGLTCDQTTKLCVAKPADVALNGACDGAGLGKCKNGLWCDPATASTGGVCHAQQTSGACTDSQACAHPTICAGAEGSKACVTPKALGESCTPGWRECSIVSHCGDDQKCTDAPAALDQPCGILAGESVPCAADAYCDGGLLGGGTCKPKKQPDAPCDGKSVGECDGTRGHCDKSSHTCVACP